MKLDAGRDEALIRRVAQALYDTEGLSVTDLRVDMLDGTVTVQGNVTTPEELKLAQHAVASFPEARQIEMRIRVDDRDPASGSDTSEVSLGAGPGSDAAVSSI
ncbi:hypothetical protein BH10PSE17_BH10PSE17_03750 [soil metagenome]